jgi:hypothetical protein
MINVLVYGLNETEAKQKLNDIKNEINEFKVWTSDTYIQYRDIKYIVAWGIKFKGIRVDMAIIPNRTSTEVINSIIKPMLVSSRFPENLRIRKYGD